MTARATISRSSEPDDVPAVPRLESERTVRGCRTRVELPRLGDGSTGQLGAGDAGWEAEVVLDPAGRPGLPTKCSALDDERVEPLRGAVHGGGEPGRPGADDQQIDLLTRLKLQPDADGPHDLTRRRGVQLPSPREPHERRRTAVRRFLFLPGEGQLVGAGELEHAHRWPGGVRADDLEADPLHSLQRLPPRDERGKDQIAQLAVLIEERAESTALDCDVPHRLDDERIHEHRLPGEEVQLAEKARRALPDQLVPGRVDDRDFPVEERDEWICPIANLVEQFTGVGRPLLAELGKCI